MQDNTTKEVILPLYPPPSLAVDIPTAIASTKLLSLSLTRSNRQREKQPRKAVKEWKIEQSHPLTTRDQHHSVENVGYYGGNIAHQVEIVESAWG